MLTAGLSVAVAWAAVGDYVCRLPPLEIGRRAHLASVEPDAMQVLVDANRSKRQTFAHGEALKVLAGHARHDGLALPGMPTMAKELGVKERQAFRLIADLELADLVKVHEGGGRGHSHHYWVRVPWVDEPESVLDLPQRRRQALP